LSINTTTLQSAFSGDPVGAASLLNKAVQSLNAVASGYANDANANPANGLEAKGNAIASAYASGLPAGLSSAVPAPLYNALILDELNQGSNVLGLSGLNTFA
jgi:hypothetical protein